ncbi:MAG: hypothetical protein AABY44_08845 [Nitrospirota bacterium]
METKGILRVVLLIVSSLMMLGSICDKDKGGGNPAGGKDPHIEVWPKSAEETFNFGEVVVGKSKNLEGSIMNYGQADLIYYGPSTNAAPPPFDIINYAYTFPCSLWAGSHVLKFGEKCFFTVKFAPEEAGYQTAWLIVTSNDPKVPIVYKKLEGTGVLPVSPDIVPPPEPAPKTRTQSKLTKSKVLRGQFLFVSHCPA